MANWPVGLLTTQALRVKAFTLEAIMNRGKLWWMGPLFALGVICSTQPPLFSQQHPSAKPRVDLGSFAKEILVLNLEGNQRQLAMWFPFEFFVEANLAEAGKGRADVEKELGYLRPYHIIVVQCGLDRDDGSTAYASQKEVRARAVLKPDNGNEIEPLQKIPPLVAATVEAMKTLMAAEGDEGGANLHVLLFPATTKSGKTIIDTSKKGKLTLILKADDRFQKTTIAWHTPFDATTPVPPCPKCNESTSAKWSFCPWCGQRLDPK